MKKIVLDTNCLLVAVQPYSRYNWLWQAFCEQKYALCYTTEVLNEYFEILSRYYSVTMAKAVIDAILDAPHSCPVTVYYKWNLISADPDDNKFVDCALNVGADYLVTNDRHFNILKMTGFPPIKIVDIETFKTLLNK